MDRKTYYLISVILGMIVVPEARVINRRALPKDESSGNEEIPFSLKSLDKDNKLGDSPGFWDQPIRDDAGVNNPQNRDETPIKKPKETDLKDVDTDKSGDETFYEPFDENDKSVNKDRRPSVPIDEDMPRGDKDDDKAPVDYDDVKKKNVPIDERNHRDDEEEDEHKKHATEYDDKVNRMPEEEGESKLDRDYYGESRRWQDGDYYDDYRNTGYGRGFFDMSPMFYNPFFNLRKVRNYFDQLNRAIQHIFRQTEEEALLLNGTYANTTEEEVDIHGKKYIVQKSLIKGADNHSSIYVESLSAKSKPGDPVKFHFKEERRRHTF